MNKHYQEHRGEILAKRKVAYAENKDVRETQKAYVKEWQKLHPEYLGNWRKEHPTYHSNYTQTLKREVLTHYGNGKLACVLCGFENIKALSIDHVNSDGNKHRGEIAKSSGANFYSWLKKNSYPLGFRTLCMNCQYITRK